jgi:[DsrC]-trisulfide reductase subunit M
MKAIISLLAVLTLVLIAWVGAGSSGAQYLFGVVIPYLALAIFLLGFIWRIIGWARVPVPFRIPTTGGQQKSLSWIKNDNLDNPHTMLGVIVRMLLEVLLFRSLFRNTKAEFAGDRLVFGEAKLLWLFALIFHWSFLIIFIRHFRLFLDPVPQVILLVDWLDSVFQIGVPALYWTDVGLLVGVSYLFIRRVVVPQIRYISLPADYFPLFLIGGIGVTGVLMRYFIKVDIVGVKQLAVGLFSLTPTVPEGIGAIFFIHLLLVSSLLIYIPMSKLMHMGGVFMSPTRNLANNNRAKRHVNPWGKPPEFTTYAMWESTKFKIGQEEKSYADLMRDAGIPTDND